MAVEFLSDEQAARYGAFHGAPSRAELGRYFFLDDADREAVQAKRRAHNRLGFGVQLMSVRYLGRFMSDPRQVPVEVADYLAEQLEIGDPSCLKQYGERDGTARIHAGEIQEAGGWRDFAEVRDELSAAGRAGLDDRGRAEGVARRGGRLAVQHALHGRRSPPAASVSS